MMILFCDSVRDASPFPDRVGHSVDLADTAGAQYLIPYHWRGERESCIMVRPHSITSYIKGGKSKKC
jgi:hypothetical protein